MACEKAELSATLESLSLDQNVGFSITSQHYVEVLISE